MPFIAVLHCTVPIYSVQFNDELALRLVAFSLSVHFQFPHLFFLWPTRPLILCLGFAISPCCARHIALRQTLPCIPSFGEYIPLLVYLNRAEVRRVVQLPTAVCTPSGKVSARTRARTCRSQLGSALICHIV